jgi:hypothetical protein
MTRGEQWLGEFIDLMHPSSRACRSVAHFNRLAAERYPDRAEALLRFAAQWEQAAVTAEAIEAREAEKV